MSGLRYPLHYHYHFGMKPNTIIENEENNEFIFLFMGDDR